MFCDCEASSSPAGPSASQQATSRLKMMMSACSNQEKTLLHISLICVKLQGNADATTHKSGNMQVR